MQTWTGQNAAGASSPTRKFITTILIVFSLAGLVIGFTVGGLTRPKTTTTSSTNPTTKPTVHVQVTATATPTATPQPDIVLGPPAFTSYSTIESATSNAPYTVSIQAQDKKKKAVHSGGITCKLWLVQQIPAHRILSIDPQILKNVDTLGNPIQGTLNGPPQPVVEIAGGLVFTTNTQTTTCDGNGQATWEYTIASTVTPGTYDLVILTDWKGKHYNWSWADITIS